MPFPDLRLRNIFDPTNMWQSQVTSDPYITPPTFGGNQMQQPQQPGIESIGPMDYDVNTRLRELYSPENMASERFNQLIQNFPQRNEPGALRKILSGVIGLGQGPEAQERALFGPYHRQLEDWKAQIGPAQQAANLERQQNINERMLANQVIGRELGEKKLELGERAQTEKERSARAKESLATFKSQHPDWKLVTTKGGKVHAINPQDPTKTVDTGIDSGTLSDIDKINLGLESSLTQIGARGEEARKTEEVRQTGREKLVGLRGAEQRKTLEKRRDLMTKGEKGELPSQTKTRIFNNAQRAMIEYPEWSDYIEADPRGNITVHKPSTGAWWSRGPDEDTYDAITEFIYGNIPSPPGRERPTGSVVEPPPAKKPATIKPSEPTAEVGRIIVEDAEGDRYSLPAKQRAQAEAKGYKVVK